MTGIIACWYASVTGGGHGNPLQYSCLENPHGQRSLAGCSPWGPKELDAIKRLSTQSKMGASLVARTVKDPSALQETRVRSLGWEDPLEEGMATHSSTVAWRIPMDRGAWRAAVHGVAKSQTGLSD